MSKNNSEYYNNPDDSKKKNKGFRFAGFYITYKALFIGLAIFAVIFIYTEIKSANEKAEIRKRQEEAMNRQATVTEVPQQEYDYHAELQKSLVKQYGEAPEGFEWDMMGNLVSLTNEESMTYEDVAYAFIRSCSILDFSTAGKYSLDSYIIGTFKEYYEGIYTMVNYYDNFLRKQFKFSLTTLEINDVKDMAIMEDGTAVISMNVSCLDLQDKDFWLQDQEKIFDELYYYDIIEKDTTKANEYLYDYIYSAYEDGTVGKSDFDIDLIVGKKNGGGWYVADDSELRDVLSYESGKDVAAYILELYSRYSTRRSIAESIGKDFDYETLEGSSDYRNSADTDSAEDDLDNDYEGDLDINDIE